MDEDGRYIFSQQVLDTIEATCRSEDVTEAREGYELATCVDCLQPYYRANRGRSVRCCRCRKIHKARNTLSGVVKIQPGYPQEDALQTVEEVEAYYDNEKLTCLLCGNAYKSLVHHLSAIHRTSVDDYKLRFGLPLSRGLSGSKLRKQQAQRGKLDLAHHLLAAAAKNQAAGKPHPGAGPGRGYGHSPALKAKHAKATGEAAKTNPNQITKQTELVTAYCSKCDKPLPEKVPAHVAVCHSCKLLCDDCKAGCKTCQHEKMDGCADGHTHWPHGTPMVCRPTKKKRGYQLKESASE